MHSKTYAYMMSSKATEALKSELKVILRRDDQNVKQTMPSEFLHVAMAELALNYITREPQHNSENLLDIIGALHSRNKGLQKGHATLTRRVQELESLVEKQQSALSASQENLSESYTVNKELEASLKGCHEAISRLTGVPQTRKEHAAVSVADSKLQADIEALTKRVTAMEFAASPGKYSAATTDQTLLCAADDFSDAVKMEIEKQLQVQGVIYRAIRR